MYFKINFNFEEDILILRNNGSLLPESEIFLFPAKYGNFVKSTLQLVQLLNDGQMSERWFTSS